MPCKSVVAGGAPGWCILRPSFSANLAEVPGCQRPAELCLMPRGQRGLSTSLVIHFRDSHVKPCTSQYCNDTRAILQLLPGASGPGAAIALAAAWLCYSDAKAHYMLPAASSGFQLLGSRSHISSTRPKVEHIWNPENETEQSVRVFQDQNRRVALRLIPSLQDLCDFSCACFFFMSCCVPLCSLSDATTVPEAHATSSAVLPSIRTKYGLCEFRSGVLLFIAFHA